MTEEEKIENIVKDKIKENVNKIIQNTLTEDNLQTLINEEINKQIKEADSYAKLITSLMQQKPYHLNNGQPTFADVKQLLLQVFNIKQETEALKKDYHNLNTENKEALTLLNKTTNDAVSIKNDLSAYRNQLVNGCLFRAFEVRAEIYDKKAQIQERWSIRYLWVLGCVSLCRIVYFFFVEYKKEDLLLNGKFWISLLLSGLFAALLYILSHLSSNKYHMNKKLAEEYWHKASILKSFVGYKTQYQQNMEDAEYKVFFEYLVKTIMLNPADKINVFLNKKLPIEKILETPKNIVEGIKEVAKNVED